MKSILILLLQISFLAASTTHLTGQAEIQIDTNSTITISGTSNLHDWQSHANSIRGDIVFDLEGSQEIMVLKCVLTIPVTAIKSEKGKIMDNKTYRALLSGDHPEITFKTVNPAKLAPDQPAKVNGLLTIAGKTRDVTLELNLKSTERGKWNVEGSITLLMTDFDIDPPTALLGTLKTGDEITVNYDIRLSGESAYK